MSTEIPPIESIPQTEPIIIPEKVSEKKLEFDLEENQISSNFLNIYTSFNLTPLEQILINKLIPNGFKIETEENLLKKDDKKKKGYIHVYL